MLKVVRDRIFEEPEFEIVPTYQKQARQIVKQLLHCYHVAKKKIQQKIIHAIYKSQKWKVKGK
jgi:hypothetical protein